MADQKISALTENTSPAGTDVAPIVSGTTNQKATLANVITKGHGLSSGVIKVASGVMTSATAGTDYYAPGGTDVAVTDGGTGLSAVAAGSVLAANSANTLTAITSTSGTYVLTNTSGTIAWGSSSSGLSWAATASGTSGTGLTLTVSDSAAASTIGQLITITDTQTNPATGLKINYGTSNTARVGLYLTGAGYSDSKKAIYVENTHTATSGGVGLQIGDLSTVHKAMFATLLQLGCVVNASNSYPIKMVDCLFEEKYSSGTTGRTNALYTFAHKKNMNSTQTDSFNVGYFKREMIANNASYTLTSQGSVLALENVVTITAGTLTDSAAVLKLTQDSDSTGGHILFNAYTGTPATNGTLYYDGTNLKLYTGGAANSLMHSAGSTGSTTTASGTVAANIGGTTYYLLTAASA